MIEAVLLTSTSLVAVIVSVPAVAGAVYKPVELTCPLTAFQVTDLSVVVPVMVAASCSISPVGTDGALGAIAIEATWEPLSPLPCVGLGVGLELLAGFAVAREPAHPLAPNKTARAKEITVKLGVLTLFLKFLNAKIM